MSSSSGLKARGWPRRRFILMWLAVTLVSALYRGREFMYSSIQKSLSAI
jgi:hypothetical protein